MKRFHDNDTGIPKTDGFVAPPSYFDDIHKNIQEKLDVSEVKIINLHRYKKYYFAAASVAALAVLFFALNRNKSEEIKFNDIANSDIENYFEDYSSDFSSYEIAEVLPVDELEIADLMTTALSDEIILNYLDNNTDEFEELNLEYDE